VQNAKLWSQVYISANCQKSSADLTVLTKGKELILSAFNNLNEENPTRRIYASVLAV